MIKIILAFGLLYGTGFMQTKMYDGDQDNTYEKLEDKADNTSVEMDITLNEFLDYYNSSAVIDPDFMQITETNPDANGHIITTKNSENGLDTISLKVNPNGKLKNINYSGGNLLYTMPILQALDIRDEMLELSDEPLDLTDGDDYDKVFEGFERVITDQEPFSHNWERRNIEVHIDIPNPDKINLKVHIKDK